MRTLFASLSLAAVVLATAPATAQDSDPEDTSSAPPAVTLSHASSSVDDDGHEQDALAVPRSHAHTSLRELGRHAEEARIGGGVSLLLVGGAAIAGGLLADLEFKRDFGQVLWITGIVSAASGALSLFAKSRTEKFAARGAYLSAPELESAWAAEARSARSTRHISGVVGTVLGLAAAGVGVAIAAGAGDLGDEAKAGWSVGLVTIGGAVVGSGVATLLVDTEIEQTYSATYGRSVKEAGVTIAPRGAGIGGTF